MNSSFLPANRQEGKVKELCSTNSQFVTFRKVTKLGVRLSGWDIYVIQKVNCELYQGLHDPTAHARFNIRREGGTERRGVGGGNGKVEEQNGPK